MTKRTHGPRYPCLLNVKTFLLPFWKSNSCSYKNWPHTAVCPAGSFREWRLQEWITRSSFLTRWFLFWDDLLMSVFRWTKWHLGSMETLVQPCLKYIYRFLFLRPTLVIIRCWTLSKTPPSWIITLEFRSTSARFVLTKHSSNIQTKGSLHCNCQRSEDSFQVNLLLFIISTAERCS